MPLLIVPKEWGSDSPYSPKWDGAVGLALHCGNPFQCWCEFKVSRVCTGYWMSDKLVHAEIHGIVMLYSVLSCFFNYHYFIGCLCLSDFVSIRIYLTTLVSPIHGVSGLGTVTGLPPTVSMIGHFQLHSRCCQWQIIIYRPMLSKKKNPRWHKKTNLNPGSFMSIKPFLSTLYPLSPDYW